MKAEITHRVANHLFVEVISAHVTTKVAGKKPFAPYVCLMVVTLSQQILLVEKKRIKKVRFLAIICNSSLLVFGRRVIFVSDCRVLLYFLLAFCTAAIDYT
jgi:hypothetical protein